MGGLNYSNIKPEDFKVVETEKRPPVGVGEREPRSLTHNYIFFKFPDDEKARENEFYFLTRLKMKNITSGLVGRIMEFQMR